MAESLKHILFLPEWYPNPNDKQLAVFVEKHARAAALHHKVSLVYCGPYSSSGKMEFTYRKHDNFTEYFCFYPKAANRVKAYRYFIRAHALCFKKLQEDNGTPDLVHLHMLFRNFVAYKKVYASKIPAFILTEQWSGYLSGVYKQLGFLKKRWYKKAFAESKLNTAVSEKLAKTIDKTFTTQHSTMVLPNIAEAVKGKKIPSKTLRVLVVADLVDKVKNISGVILAFSLARFDQEARLTIIGDGEDREELEKMAAEIGKDNKEIVFKGRYENPAVLAAMQENDFLITNSYHETFSMVTAEALLAGMPVICTRCGGPEEFVNETNGILIAVDQYPELQAAMEKMAKTWNHYPVANLSKPVLDKFGLETVGQQIKNIYARVIN